MNYKKIGLVIAAVLLLPLLTAGTCTHQSAPDPTPGNTVNGINIVVIKMPDGFRNVAVACMADGTGVYVTSASAADTLPSGVAVLKDDPLCQRAGR